MRSSVLVCASFTVLALTACGGSTPDPNDPSQVASGQYGQTGQYAPTGQYGQYGQTGQYDPNAQYGQTGQYAPTGQYQPAPATTATAQPTGLEGILAGIPGLGGQPASSGTGSATPIAFAAALTPAIQMLASSEAPGMQADGQAFAGQFQEGQTLTQAINIGAGRCYTILAASAGTIQQLDVQLVIQQAPMPAMVLAQGSGSTTATVGGRSSGCFKNPLPIGGPGQVILKATRGSGIAGAQVFVK